ncbi:MAG: DEAD/DEAH box helicase [Tannerella sp.]|jgi:superfamily II DNA or RNA helicase|nr:DEAD/DEAH box helicase [Tannerella sp.]
MINSADHPFFAVIIRKHRFLERIFSAHLIRVSESDPDCLTSVSRLSPDTFGQFDYTFSDAETNIIKTIGRYSDDQLLILLRKNVKSLPEFFKLMESDQEMREYIRNYVERMMLMVFDIAAANKIPFYLKKEDFENIFADHCLAPVPDPAEVIFNFELNKEEIRYYLSAACGMEEITLCSPHSELICTNPCILRVEKKIYKFPSIDGKKLSPFLSKPYISIPGSTKRKYMETFVLNAIHTHRVVAKGFGIQDVEKDRRIILSLEERFSGGWAFFLRLGYGDRDYLYGSGQKIEVSLEVDHDNYCFYRFKRDPEWEEQQAALLPELGLVSGMSASEYTPAGYENSVYGLIGWVNDNRETLQERNIVVKQQNSKTPFYLGNSIIDVLGEENEDWFDIYGQIKLNGYEIPFIHIRRHIMNDIREFVLPDDKRFVIPEAWYTRYKTLFLFGREFGDKLMLPRVLFNLLVDSGIEAPDAYELRRRFIESKPDEITIPAGLKASLRNYQKEGVMWLKLLDMNHIGGCLADDMGLGKTLQALTFFQMMKEERDHKERPGNLMQLNKTTLIVVPTSLVHNWLNEIQRFTSGFRVHVFTGAQRTKSIDRLTYYDLVITTYGVVRNDIDLLKDILFDYVVLDESQLIKNPASKIYHAVLLLNARGFLTLSGTPIENSLMDLWAQLNFLNRGVLGSQKSFHEEFVVPIEKEGNDAKKSLLKKLIEPFVLRRKKEEVAKDLPEITEQIVYCEMTDSQAEIYETEKNDIRNTILQNISEQGFERSAISILRGLTRLRQISNHPAMIYAQEDLDSGKFEEIVRALENVISEGHKALVFSSFVKHLNLVAAYFDKTATKYEMLTGSTANREEVVHKFRQDANIPIFLISIKAGGLGLNLTAADYIFILDPWWNPAVENQAVSRAHRIGQDKNLFVYRFISVGTVEEKIVRMQEKKELLAKDFVESANPLRLLGKEKILEMLN